MIARVWDGLVPTDYADGFEQHLRETGVAEAASGAGFLGAEVLRSPVPEGVGIRLITYWDSWEAVNAFTSDQPDAAVLYPGDDAFELVSCGVEHHYVLSRTLPGVASGAAVRHDPLGVPRSRYYTNGYEFSSRARLLYVSSQQPVDKAGQVVGETIVEQATKVLENVALVLHHAGMTLEDVVKITSYLSFWEDLEGYREVRRRYFPLDKLPASTTILQPNGDAGIRIEVEAIAARDEAV